MKTTNYTKEQIEAAAKSLGFQNAELMLAYFKAQVFTAGLYEQLKASN